MNIIITQQLSNALPKSHPFQKHEIVNPECFKSLYKLLKSIKNQKIIIYDRTYNKTLQNYVIVPINDHINCSGDNPLIGHQKLLNIDFLEIGSLYKQYNQGIITHCCGKILNIKYSYPSHFICHIAILAKVVGIEKIQAYLLNDIGQESVIQK